MSATATPDFWASIRRQAAELEHSMNLAGKTRVKCGACSGTGHREPGRTDWDAHGSYWVPPDPCRACGGAGRLEVKCSPEVEAAAIEREIEALRVRLGKLKGKVTP